MSDVTRYISNLFCFLPFRRRQFKEGDFSHEFLKGINAKIFVANIDQKYAFVA